VISPKRACCPSPTTACPSPGRNPLPGATGNDHLLEYVHRVLTIGSLIGLTWLLLGTRKGESKGAPTRPWATASTASRSTTTRCQVVVLLFVGTLVFRWAT
jgi:hypothetical protein